MTILYLLIVLLILYIIFSFISFNKKENFVIDYRNSSIMENKVYIDENIYDNFYTFIYDDILVTIPYYEELINKTKNYLNSTSSVLCLGSKTGHIVQLLSNNIETIGLENSMSMIKMSKYKYPENTYIYGNYLNGNLFRKNQFTHVYIPLFNIHTIYDLDTLFTNLSEWIVHKGYIFITYSELNNFPSHKLMNYNQSKQFSSKYQYNVELDRNQLKETIKDDNFKIRTNIQHLIPHKINQINMYARNNGFVNISIIDYDKMPFKIAVYRKDD
jgi:hypothetical protein